MRPSSPRWEPFVSGGPTSPAPVGRDGRWDARMTDVLHSAERGELQLPPHPTLSPTTEFDDSSADLGHVVVHDSSTGRYLRIKPPQFAVLRELDGSVPLADVVARHEAEFGAQFVRAL